MRASAGWSLLRPVLLALGVGAGCLLLGEAIVKLHFFGLHAPPREILVPSANSELVYALAPGTQHSFSKLLERQEAPIEVEEDAIHEVATVFALWRSLQRVEKQRILQDFGIRLRIGKVPGTARRRVVAVESVRIGFLADSVIYKKMKRLGVE